MRGEKAIFLYNGAMADVIATPKNNVIANAYKWLNDVVFEYEAIVTHLHVMPNERVAAHIIGTPETFGSHLPVKPHSYSIELGVGYRHKDLEAFRRIQLL